MTDGSGTTDWTYDTLGRPSSETQSRAHRQLAYGYDSESHRTSLAVSVLSATGDPVGSAWTTTYGYDNAGRLHTVLDGRQSSAQAYRYRYTAGTHWVDRIDLPGNQVTSRIPDGLGRLLSTTTKRADTTTAGSFAYTYDRAGRRSLETTPEATRTFGYDQYGQLTTAATVKPDTTPELTLDYTYDPIGNRLTTRRESSSEASAKEDTYTANAVNQYTAITGADTAAPEYDPNGNATAIDGQVLTWDEENRLATSTDGFRTTMYLYDGLGRRVEKSEYEAAVLKTTTRYVYDGWRVVEELDLSLGTSALSLVRSYTRGLDLSGSLEGAGGIGGLLSITLQPSVTGEFAPVSASYLYDGNGNVTGLLGDNGAELARYRYDPFGQLLSATGTWAELNPYQFSSKERDAATGFYYYGYRYYSPTTGRWLSRDPLEEQGGVNLYGFVGNDPLNDSDSLGLESWWRAAARTAFNMARVLIAPGYLIAKAIGKYLLPCIGDQLLDLLQLGLDGLGLIPGLGEVFDGINALISFARGDYAAAALSIAAMVPFAGWAATAAKGALRYADNAVRAGLNLTRNVAEAGWRAAKNAATDVASRVAREVSANAVQKSTANAATGAASRAVRNSVGDAASRTGKNVVENIAQKSKCGEIGCFIAGTLLATIAGAQPIEAIEVGDRVFTSDQQAETTQVDPSTWRKITLEMPNPRNPSDLVDLELLRSQAWMAEAGCAEGAEIWIDVEEMDLHGPATVVAVEDCPPIQSGPGRVVLSTMTHFNSSVLELKLAGREERLCPTASHPLYSQTRQGWVPAGQIEVGELLVTREGTVSVEAVSALPGTHRVYNIEVEVDHCYFTGSAQVLSHNACPPSTTAAENGAGTLARGNINHNIVGGVHDGYAGHHLIGIVEANNSPVMARAADLGYNINRGTNGIALPTEIAESIATGLPLHNGRHLGEYTEYVEAQLSRLQNRHELGAVTDQSLLREVSKVEANVRQALLERRIRLQNADPHF